MTHIIANRVAETSVTAGTGDFVLVAQSGYRRFGDRMAVGDTCWYVAEQFSAGVPVAWEIGRGTYKGGNTLGRTAVYESTNGNAPVIFDGSKKTITMAAVAPDAATAPEWLKAIGSDKVIQFLVPGGAQPGQALVINQSGTGLVGQTIGTGGTTTPTDPTVSQDFTNLVAMLDAATLDVNAKIASLT